MRKKKKRMGRPPLPKGIKKGNLIAIKLDNSELEALDKKAKKLGLSRSEVVRRGVKLILDDE